MLVAVALVVALFILRFLLPAGTPRIHLKGKSDPAKSIALLEKLSMVEVINGF